MFERLKLFLEAMRQTRALRQGRISEAEMADAMTRKVVELAGEDPDRWMPKIDLSQSALEALYDPSTDALYPESFTLGPDDVRLIRRMRLGWNGTETGAVQQDPKRPFAGAGTLDLLAEALGPEAGEEANVAFLHQRPAALRAFCHSAALDPGRYRIGNLDYVAVEAELGWTRDWPDGIGLTPEMEIEVTADDIALVRNAQWQWPDEDDMHRAFEAGEVAGPTVDPKRPYGDMSFFDLDVHRILGWPVEARTEEGYVEVTDAQSDEVARLHFRQLCVMQAFLEQARHPVEAAQ